MKPCKLVRISTADAGEEGFSTRPHTEALHIRCNMSIQNLPDMFARSPKAEGIHIRQIPRAHVTNYTYFPCYDKIRKTANNHPEGLYQSVMFFVWP